MAVPKGKVSRARRDKRRSSHWKLETPGLVACPKCGALRLPHRMCKECGKHIGKDLPKNEREERSSRLLFTPCGQCMGFAQKGRRFSCEIEKDTLYYMC